MSLVIKKWIWKLFKKYKHRNWLLDSRCEGEACIKDNFHVSCFYNLECFCTGMYIFRIYNQSNINVIYIMMLIGMNFWLFSKISSPNLHRNTFFSTATGRLSYGTAVSISRMGFSSRSAWFQTVIFETDTAGGKMAGGMRGRGRPDHHPLPVSVAAWLGHWGEPFIFSLAFTFFMLKLPDSHLNLYRYSNKLPV